uniref:ABC transporter permease n=1 Tax=candidate division WOR-3 bacterium TaxID=2052148 RepID=A0A7C2PLL1_UNCW3
MIRKLRFYLATAIVYFKVSYNYKVHFIGMILQNVLTFVILFLYFKWTGEIKDMSTADLVTYYLLMLAFFSHIIPTVDVSFFDKLRSGGLDGIITLPVSLNGYFVSLHIELLVFKFLVSIIIFLLIAPLIPLKWPSLNNFLMFIIASSISLVLYFVFRIFFTQFAYYIERADALSFWSYYLSLFLSGGLLPLRLFPETLRKLLYFTPFPYLIDYPIGIWIGKYHFDKTYLIISLIYVLVMGSLTIELSKRGMRKYAAYGG